MLYPLSYGRNNTKTPSVARLCRFGVPFTADRSMLFLGFCAASRKGTPGSACTWSVLETVQRRRLVVKLTQHRVQMSDRQHLVYFRRDVQQLYATAPAGHAHVRAHDLP